MLAGATCRDGATYAHNVYGGQTCSGEAEVSSTPERIKAGMVGPTGCCGAGNDYRLKKGSVLVDRGDPADHPKVDASGVRSADSTPDAGMDELGGRGRTALSAVGRRGCGRPRRPPPTRGARGRGAA